MSMENMKNLTVGNILERIRHLKEDLKMTDAQIAKIPVFIGNDDELNGIHTAWYAQEICRTGEDDKYYFEMIEERRGNAEPADISFLIS